MLTIKKPGQLPLLYPEWLARAPVVGNGLILGLLLVAFALRLYKVSSIPLNIDEVHTILRYIPLAWVDIFMTPHSNNHPLTSALARLFSPGADHLFMMRWPSILIGMISLPFVYRLGANLFGRKVGLVALLLVSTSPVHIGYSMIIRGYIGLISLTTISLYFLERALLGNRWHDWLGLAVVNSVIVYFHLFGMLAAGMQLGLVGAWLLWQISQGPAGSFPYKSVLAKFALITALLGGMYFALIYLRASSIIVNERWLDNEFQVWQDGIFSLSQDLSPLVVFASLMAPMSPAGIGIYIYLVFWVIGLATLWARRRVLAIGLIISFVGSFVAVFVALQLLGSAFYTYVRFLLYLLPPFLILVALGMVMAVDRLSALIEGWGWPWQGANRLVTGVTSAGLLIIIVNSLHWYMLTSVHTDWLALSKTLSLNLQPQDVTLCEEHERGFAAPDQAKPHCLWMLDFLVPQLHGAAYTPRLQSSTDVMADYDYLLAQRQTMVKSGHVWLIIWQKIPFRPDDLIVQVRPPVAAPPPLSNFEPYQAWHFGSATLVHIDSEETLLGNIYKAVELLLQVESQPADQARYYRSLAELEAVQGHKPQAHSFFEKSWRLVEQAGQQYPDIFLAETRQVIDRLPDAHPLPETALAIDYKFGPSLCLQSYTVSSDRLEAGQPLQLELYWQPIDFVPENYTFFIRLEAGPDQSQAQLEFQPFNGTYPTSWWWVGQQVIEQQEFYIPPDLKKQDYVVHLGAYDSQAPGEVVTLPLFLLRYKAGSPAYWRVEATPAQFDEGCLTQ